MKLQSKNNLVHGVGINDADYVVKRHSTVGGKDKIVWNCPFYMKWKDMLRRCYSDAFQARSKTYNGCLVIEEWMTFSVFRRWMETQDFEGKELDKDILFRGNKLYSPDNCVFVDHNVNSFLLERKSLRGKWPIGVSWNKRDNMFMAVCRSVSDGKKKNLGYFDTPEQAHRAWLEYKLSQAYLLAAQQADKRVAKALIDRYENYDNQTQQRHSQCIT